jgi:hypothetical protein
VLHPLNPPDTLVKACTAPAHSRLLSGDQRPTDRHQGPTAVAADARLLLAWKQSHREERIAVLAGAHGPALAELFRMLDNINHVRPRQPVGLVQSIAWTAIDYPTRLVVLHETNSAISKQGERLGFAPFDDGMPGDRPNVFSLIQQQFYSPNCPPRAGAMSEPMPTCKPQPA